MFSTYMIVLLGVVTFVLSFSCGISSIVASSHEKIYFESCSEHPLLVSENFPPINLD